MAWQILVAVVATLATQTLASYPVGLLRLASQNPFSGVSATELEGIKKCQFVVDQEDPKKVQHVQYFYWYLENYVWVNPSYPLCIVPGQVYSYAECGCVYDERFPAVEAPRVGGGNTTARVPEKCKDLAGLVYDADKGRYVSSSYASIKGATADLGRRTERVQGTQSNFALRLNDGPVKLQAFAGNDLQGTWRAKLRVRPTAQAQITSPMLLLSDDCDDNPNEKEREVSSIVVSMVGSTLSVNLRFKNDSQATQCNVANSEWYEIVMESSLTRVKGTVNGNPCFDIPSPGAPLAMTECALFVGGDPRGDAKKNFDGYLDSFKFVKNFDSCVEDKP